MYRLFCICLISTCLMLVGFSGCSSGPKLSPEETVEAFFRLALEGDIKGSMKYVEGIDAGYIEKNVSMQDRGEEVREKFFDHCTSELLEEGEHQSKVRWHIDLKSIESGKIVEEMGYEKSRGAKYLQQYIDKQLEAYSTIDFTLRKRRGHWKITALEYPGLK